MGGVVFGQFAKQDQFLSVVVSAITAALYFLDVIGKPLMIGVLALCVFWFIIPGHGLLYGPHLWIVYLIDMVRGEKNGK